MSLNPKDYITRMSPENAKAFLRRILGPSSRTLEGKEKNDVILMLALMEPFKQTNNQHSWTDYYMMGNKEYHVTNFSDDEVIVEQMLPEDDQ
jgi:L-rhamnose isomerase